MPPKKRPTPSRPKARPSERPARPPQAQTEAPVSVVEPEILDAPVIEGFRPQILAPAGDAQSFLAALAAGADAVYLGLKHFSARMQADNFGVTELSRCAELARERGVKLYVTLNSLLKPGDLDAAGRLIDRLQRGVKPDALIVQDLGVLALARQAGYKGEIHLSTLANLTHPASLQLAARLGAQRAVLPRELDVDEIKLMAAACPDDFGLEVFVHGALCFCVSGRCYWSSYLGGKSGLRGRCVQPCRRVYNQKHHKGRFFSCLDLSLDLLVKTLLSVPQVKAWKIEGRKKGPHYVFYATTAYRLLRDNPHDPQVKKEALDILEHALGRPSTHYWFLPQRKHSPVKAESETGSGLLAARVAKTPDGKCYVSPRFPLMPNDLLRVGYDDEPWRQLVKVRRATPKGGRFDLKIEGKRTPPVGVAVFLVDRREPELERALSSLNAELEKAPAFSGQSSHFSPILPKPYGKRLRPRQLTVLRKPPQGKVNIPGELGLWLSAGALKALSHTVYERVWWWLPPVIWPGEEENFRELARMAFRGGGRRFVCNAPWQAAFFESAPEARLTAGPFCNASNPLALEVLASMGFSQAILSPELSGPEYLALPRVSPLPLGLVVHGRWPVGISRIKPETVRTGEPFSSPMREQFWTYEHGQNLWIYPSWPLDLTPHLTELEQAGYSLFVEMVESAPSALGPATRGNSVFNWEVGLL
jgi:putative protease